MSDRQTPTNAPTEVILTIHHDEYPSFLGRYYATEISWVVLSHYLFLALFVAVWLNEAAASREGVSEWIGSVVLLVLAGAVLLPVHESIHAIAVWATGARDVRFGWSRGRGGIYATAHHHVVSAQEAVWIAVAPFLVVLTTLAAALAAFPEAQHSIVGVVMVHTVMCAGDWAILNVLWFVRDRETYLVHDDDHRAIYVVSPHEPDNDGLPHP